MPKVGSIMCGIAAPQQFQGCIMQIRPSREHDRWSYDVYAGPNNPVLDRLLAYLQRESLTFLPVNINGAPIRIGPLHPEQAFTFESHWRPFVT
jgi:hypothetical protein